MHRWRSPVCQWATDEAETPNQRDAVAMGEGESQMVGWGADAEGKEVGIQAGRLIVCSTLCQRPAGTHSRGLRPGGKCWSATLWLKVH